MEAYGQMANMSSGSTFGSNSNTHRSSFMSPSVSSSMTTNDVEFIDDIKNEETEDSDQNNAAVYNFPWDFKNKQKQLLLQTQVNETLKSNSVIQPLILSNSVQNSLSSNKAPPPIPQCPPPSTLNSNKDKMNDKNDCYADDDESQYCAPWDLKLQEEMFKRMSAQKKDAETKGISRKNSINNNSIDINHIESDIVNKSNGNDNSINNSSLNNNNNNNISLIKNSNELNSSIKSNKSTDLIMNSQKQVTQPTIEAEDEYSPPWELKQTALIQSIQTQNSLMPAPLSTSSAVSTLTNQNPSALSSLFNQFSRTRLSTRSNTSSSSSTRSSTSSLSTNSPPSIPQPPSIPPPPPPMSSTINRCNSTCSQNHHIQQSPRLSHHPSSVSNPRNAFNNGILKPTLNCNSMGTCNSCSLKKNALSNLNQNPMTNSMINSNSNMTNYLNESTSFSRQNRAGSSHHFGYPTMTNHFPVNMQGINNNQQIGSTLDSSTNTNIQLGMPVTALVFNQTSSLPTGILPLTIQHSQKHHSQQPPLMSPATLNHLNLLERQIWFHGKITRKHAENMLENRPVGSYLIRQSESGNANDFSLSLVGSGVVHMRISMKNGEYILGQCSQPFGSIVKMVEHYGRVEVPIKGALHVKLNNPVPIFQ